MYCSALWDSIWIEHNGDVSPCCLAKSRRQLLPVIGNVYKAPINIIYNNNLIKELRHKELSNNLPCHQNCHLKLCKHDTIPNSMTATYKNITLRINAFCNINCIMCTGHRQDLNIGIDFEKLKNNLCLNLFTDIQLTGGEPLAIPTTDIIFEYITSLDKQVSIMTNRLLLDKWADRLGRFGKNIYISLNATTPETHHIVNVGSNWDRVLNGIKCVKEAYTKYKHCRPNNLTIHGHMCVVKENMHELPEFLTNKLELDSVGYHFEAQALKVYKNI